MILAVLLSAIRASLPLHPLGFQRSNCDALLAFATLRDNAFLDIFDYLLTRNFMLALKTSGGSKRAMALHNLLWKNPRIGLDIINILRVVGQ